MRVKKSEFGLDKSLGQGLETLGSAKPREAIGEKLCGGAEILLRAASHR